MSDLINRQDAIDALESKNNVITEDDYHYCEDCNHIEMCRWYPLYGCEFKSRPSAEPLTDAEQRIFLKAIEREREVCEKTDAEWADDETALNLVRVCDAIERKVKGALWT